MGGTAPPAFGNFLGILLLVTFSSSGVGYLVSVISPNIQVASIVSSFFTVPFLLFGGIYTNAANIPPYFALINALSPIRYGFHCLSVLQWQQYGDIGCDEVFEAMCAFPDGNAVLEFLSLNADDFTYDLWMLFATGCFWRALGCVLLLCQSCKD